jgi:hypothetical protein
MLPGSASILLAAKSQQDAGAPGQIGIGIGIGIGIEIEIGIGIAIGFGIARGRHD